MIVTLRELAEFTERVAMMDAPICRICGKKHWSRVCDDDVTKRVTPVTTSRDTVTPPVTEVCDPPGTTQQTPRTVAPSKLTAAQATIDHFVAEIARLTDDVAVKARLLTGQAKEITALTNEVTRLNLTRPAGAAFKEIERLTNEVAHLKRQLAERALKVPMTAAERKRKMRAKAKQVV